MKIRLTSDHIPLSSEVVPCFQTLGNPLSLAFASLPSGVRINRDEVLV